jgi:hypothetical protein
VLVRDRRRFEKPRLPHWRRVPYLVAEAHPSGRSIGEAEVANAVTRLSLAVEKTTELLKAAQLLHTQLVDLDAALTEALVDLERSLKEARGEMAG